MATLDSASSLKEDIHLRLRLQSGAIGRFLYTLLFSEGDFRHRPKTSLQERWLLEQSLLWFPFSYQDCLDIWTEESIKSCYHPWPVRQNQKQTEIRELLRSVLNSYQVDQNQPSYQNFKRDCGLLILFIMHYATPTNNQRLEYLRWCQEEVFLPVHESTCGSTGQTYNIYPEIRKHWLLANDQAVLNLIQQEESEIKHAILRDALMDAGCQDSLLLDHLAVKHPQRPGMRSTCWVVHRLLEKTSIWGLFDHSSLSQAYKR